MSFQRLFGLNFEDEGAICTKISPINCMSQVQPHGQRTPNEGILNQRNLKIWVEVADKI